MVTWDSLQEGNVYGPLPYEVRDEVIRQVAQAVQDKNPIFQEEKRARQAGFPRLVAPPMLASVVLIDALRQAFAERPPGGLHAGQRFQFRGLVFAGDRLETYLRVLRKYEKRDRKYTEVETVTLNQDRAVVLEGLTTSIWSK